MSEVVYDEMPFGGYYGKPIENDVEAEEAIATIKSAKNQVEKMTAWYKQALEQIKEQQEGIIQNEIARLEGYFSKVPHNVGKSSESYQLPSGKLVRKKPQPEYKQDETILLPWVKKNAPKFLKVKESVAWIDLKKATKLSADGSNILMDGEVVPGVMVIDRDEEFKVEGI